MAEPTRVALALGSGGARGYAHIGVIQALEERGYEIVSVAGTSMGALVGGLQAAGQLEAYTAWVTGLTQRDVLRLLDRSGEFTAEVPTSATGQFRFFAGPGDWTLRTLAPGAQADLAVTAALGAIAEVEVVP